MTETYTPKAGDQVRVQRWEVPTPELPGTAEPRLLIEMDGTVESVRELHGGHLIKLAGDDADPIFTGYQHTGQDPDHGSSWSLQTEVVLQADVAAHDQAKHAERVTQGRREVDRALELWEQAQRAEVVARQRLIGARERLEVIKRARPVPAPRPDLDQLTERRKADRLAMAEQVADLARAHGLTAQVRRLETKRRVLVDLAGPHGLKLTVQFRGNSPQCEPDTYVLSWCQLPRQDEGYRLFPPVFGGSVNPYHGHKATDVANGFRDLTELLQRRFAAIADGSAFVREPSARPERELAAEARRRGRDVAAEMIRRAGDSQGT